MLACIIHAFIITPIGHEFKLLILLIHSNKNDNKPLINLTYHLHAEEERRAMYRSRAEIDY